jgi:hypothetical protein
MGYVSGPGAGGDADPHAAGVGPGLWRFTEGFDPADLQEARALLEELAVSNR